MNEIDDLRAAYRLLGAPLSATTPEIRAHYLEMVKRWHPDLYRDGTSEFSDASQMVRTINPAYSQIENAPLRHYPEHPESLNTPAPSALNPGAPVPSGPEREPYPNAERVDFWIRFVFGALLGGFLSLQLLFSRDTPFLYLDVRTFLGIAAVLMLVCGFISAHGTDDFWISLFSKPDSKSWWWWW